jgi:hypothetical protein
VLSDTVNTTVFTMKDLDTGKNVPLASVVQGGSGAEVTMIPASALMLHHRYRITVKGGENGLRYPTDPNTPGPLLPQSPLVVSGLMLAKDIRVTFRTVAE